MLGHIYRITNTENEKVYIGSTETSIHYRFQVHQCNSDNLCYGGNSELYKAMREMGNDKFRVEFIRTVRVPDTDELRREEARELIRCGGIVDTYNERMPHRDLAPKKKFCACCNVWITSQHIARHKRSNKHIANISKQ